MIAGFGAVGTSLAIGSQFSNLGKASGGDRVLALLGGLLAFVGVLGAMWLSARVLTGSHMTLGTLGAQSRDAKQGKPRSFLVRFFEDENRYILGPYGTLDDLEKRYEAAQRQGDDQEIQNIGAYVKQVVNVASYEELRHAFHRGLTRIVASVGVTAVGLLLVAVSVKGDTQEAAAASAAAPLRPVPVEVSLSDAGRKMLSDDLGADCVKANVVALAVGRDGGDLQVISLPTSKCKVASFEVSGEVGLVTASSPARRTAAPPPSSKAPLECGVFP